MPRRVGFLHDRWDPERGGAERAMALFAAHLEKRGHDVRAVALSGPPSELLTGPAPGRLHRVRPPRALTAAARARALARSLVAAARDAGCELTVGARHLSEVDLYWPHGGAHVPSLAARARARGRESVRVSARHRVYLELERGLLAGGAAARVACVSELVRAELSELYPSSTPRLELVGAGVDLERFHPRNRAGEGAGLRAELGVAAGEVLVCLPARDALLKGLAELARALASLRELPWTLLVAGPKDPRGSARLALRAGVPRPRLRVAASLPAPALHAAADLTALPTWRDPAPLSLLESLASGTPVVTTRCAGNAVLADDPAAGTVVAAPDEGDALREALGAWIERLARGEPERAAVRSRVLDHGLPAWLERMEGCLFGAEAVSSPTE